MTVDSFSEELIHNVLNAYSNKGNKINQVSYSSYVEGSRKSMYSNAIYSLHIKSAIFLINYSYITLLIDNLFRF